MRLVRANHVNQKSISSDNDRAGGNFPKRGRRGDNGHASLVGVRCVRCIHRGATKNILQLLVFASQPVGFRETDEETSVKKPLDDFNLLSALGRMQGPEPLDVQKSNSRDLKGIVVSPEELPTSSADRRMYHVPDKGRKRSKLLSFVRLKQSAQGERTGEDAANELKKSTEIADTMKNQKLGMSGKSVLQPTQGSKEISPALDINRGRGAIHPLLSEGVNNSLQVQSFLGDLRREVHGGRKRSRLQRPAGPARGNTHSKAGHRQQRRAK